MIQRNNRGSIIITVTPFSLDFMLIPYFDTYLFFQSIFFFKYRFSFVIPI